MIGHESVWNNEAESRFELTVDGKTALLSYRLRPGSIVFVHTEVPEQLGGQGVGGRLVRAGLEFAKEKGLVIIPMCPFVSSYIKRHHEYLELVSEDHRARLSEDRSDPNQSKIK